MRSILAAAALALSPLAASEATRPVTFVQTLPTSGTIVLPLGSDADLAARTAGLDAASRQAIGRALAAQDFGYELGSVATLSAIGDYAQVIVIGTGGAPLAAADLHRIGAIAARETAKIDGPAALVTSGLGIGDAAAELALGASLGGYRFDRYKAKDASTAETPLTLVGDAGPAWERRHRAIAGGVAFARDLISEPSNQLYPEIFVERTRAAFEGARNVTIDVIDEAEMAELGMGSILSVGMGSERPPRMLIVQYRGSSAQPVVLAGKGITFDSGGISLKPGSGMWRMKGDMAGAAAVVGTVHALARAGAPVNVVAIAALAENMPGGEATRPGDIVRAFNGKTIEILNTDAEGRLVLADAVSYGERTFKPAAIVDVATLTGAKVTALGTDYAALFSRSDALAAQVEAAAEATGEPVWRLPLTEDYAASIKSDFADYANVSDGGGTPGAAYGAAFIGAFVTPETPWAHLDIAGMQFGVTSPLTPTGVDAYGVRLLEQFVRDFRPVN